MPLASERASSKLSERPSRGPAPPPGKMMTMLQSSTRMNSARNALQNYASAANAINDGNKTAKLPPVTSISALFNPSGVKRNTLIGSSS